MTQHISRLHFQSSTHCALCRMRLPEPDYDIDNEPLENKVWEYEVLGFCDLSSSEKHPRIFTTRADFKSPETFSAPISTECSSLLIEFCLESECRQCEGSKIAHIIHIACWKLINTSRKRYSAASIYMFAQSIYPFFDVGGAFDSEHNTLMDFTNTTAEGLNDTNLGYLLRRFLGLPPEIRSIISANCPPSLLSSLHTVSKISPLDVAECRSGRTVIEYKYDTAVNSLRAAQTSILGQKYISSVAFNKSEGILVRRADFKGIRFTIGRYGLRALSILYADGSTSAWLGDPTNGWTGVMYGSSLKILRILKDDLKCLRVDLNTAAMSTPMSRVLWDKEDMCPPGTVSYRILDTTSVYTQIRNFPGWRLCRYLPFADGHHYISGLTMYCRGHGITGIVTHGQSNHLVGHRQGCAVHLHLQPQERITSVWLRAPAPNYGIEEDPTLLVTTSLHQTCTFGPCLGFTAVQDWQYTWTRLEDDPGPQIDGIFFDVLSLGRARRIANVGLATRQGKSILSRKIDVPRVPVALTRPRIGAEYTGLFFSVASLSEVQRLEVRKVGARYIGLAVYHYDGSVDILGQWDYDQTSDISKIYTRGDGVLVSINFHFVGPTLASSFDEIYVETGPAEPLGTRQCGQTRTFFVDQAIVWWFSRLYDHVELWHGTYQEIPLSTRIYNRNVLM